MARAPFGNNGRQSAGAVLRLALLLVAATSGWAQTVSATPDDVDELVVVGRRLRAVALERESAAVSVITRAELERSGAFDLLDALRQELGVSAYDTGGPGQQSSLFLRGGNGERIQVLVDGVRIGDAISGGFNWSLFTPETIERVEILRGPQSTLFGADAAGGVVQIFTRRAGAGKTQMSSRASIGSENDYSGGVEITGGTQGGVRYAGAVSHRKLEAISAYRGDLARNEGERDEARNTALQGQIRFPLGSYTSSLRARSIRSQAEYDSGFPVNPDSPARHDTRDFQFDWELEAPGSPFGAEGRSRLQLAQRRSRRTDLESGNDGEQLVRSTQASLVSEGNRGRHHFLAGVDFENVHGTLRNRFSHLDDRINRAAVFARSVLRFGDLGLDLGLRHEWHSRAGDSTIWQLGARYALSETLELVASGGTSFRAPDFSEFASASGALEPEHSLGGDLGLRYTGFLAPGFQLSSEVRIFQQRYRDVINHVTVNPATFEGYFFNVDRARYRGVEFEARLDRKPFWLKLRHTRITSRSSGSELWLLRRPDTGSLAAGIEWRDWSLGLALRFTGPRRDSNFPSQVRLSGYTLLDLNLGYLVSERLKLRAHLHNLGDRDYQEINGYGTLGRNFRLSAELRF